MVNKTFKVSLLLYCTFCASIYAQDENWDDRFGYNGFNKNVHAIAKTSWFFYAGGEFEFVDDKTIDVELIVLWDGLQWSDLGGGLSSFFNIFGGVHAIAIDNHDVYVGGTFDRVDYTSANNIAKYNEFSDSWSVLGDGVKLGDFANGAVYAIARDGTDVYVGGYFTEAGGQPAYNIAKWDDVQSQWSAIIEEPLGDTIPGGNGVSGRVYAIAILDGMIWVGGVFHRAGGQGIFNIARYSTESERWEYVDSPSSGIVNAILIHDDDVYFSISNHIIKYEGNTSNYTELPVEIITGDYINALAIGEDDLYIGGNISDIGGIGVNHIARFNLSTESCSGLGDGVNEEVHDLLFDDGILYAAGEFTQAGGVLANSLAKWDGSSWSCFAPPCEGLGLSDEVEAIAVKNNDVYVGGNFMRADGKYVHKIALWNGTDWDKLGWGICSYPDGGRVNAIATTDDYVYAGGTFDHTGRTQDEQVNFIVRWDGSDWLEVGGGMNDYIKALASTGNKVYAGGRFTSPGNHVAQWDESTSSWTSLGGGTDDEVLAIAVANGPVFAGGEFLNAGGNSANYIAKWDGAEWQSLGDGVDNEVYAIAVDGSDVYVGGNFDKAGGIAAANIARWNETTQTWSALGGGVSSWVYAITVKDNKVLVGGRFSTADGLIVKSISVWDKTAENWSALGSGIDGSRVNAIAFSGENVYIGGKFKGAGKKPSRNFAIWHDTGDGGGLYVATPTGTNVEVDFGNGVLLNYSDVTSAGVSSLQVTENGPDPPSGLQIVPVDPPIYYNISTTAAYSGLITIQINYDEAQLNVMSEDELKLYHYDDGSFVDITIEVNTVENYIKGQTSSLSEFAIATLEDNIVPVELVSFKAETKEGTVRLSWTTASESNNYGFNIERQIENEKWSDIGFVKGHGTSSIPHIYSFVDENPPMELLFYRIKQTDFDGEFTYYEPIKVTVTAPETFALLQNYPNPFNPYTEINYQLPKKEHVSIIIYNLQGQKVRTLVEGMQVANYYSIGWDSKDSWGRELPTGIYMYRIKAGTFIESKKMLLLK